MASVNRQGNRTRPFYLISDEDGESGERFTANRSRRRLTYGGRRNTFPGPRIRYPEPTHSILVRRSSLTTYNAHAGSDSDSNYQPRFLSMSSRSPEIRRQMHSLMVRLCAGGTHQLEGDIDEEEVSDDEEDENVNNGKSEEEIMASINREIFESDDEEENKKACGICQEDYVNGVQVGKLNCEHKFHMECIKPWLMRNNICPFCRQVAL